MKEDEFEPVESEEYDVDDEEDKATASEEAEPDTKPLRTTMGLEKVIERNWLHFFLSNFIY